MDFSVLQDSFIDNKLTAWVSGNPSAVYITSDPSFREFLTYLLWLCRPGDTPLPEEHQRKSLVQSRSSRDLEIRTPC